MGDNVPDNYLIMKYGDINHVTDAGATEEVQRQQSAVDRKH